MTCTIFSPTSIVTHNSVSAIVIRNSLGDMEILPGHSEAFILLKNANIRLGAGGDHFNVTRGVCHVHNDRILFALRDSL